MANLNTTITDILDSVRRSSEDAYTAIEDASSYAAEAQSQADYAHDQANSAIGSIENIDIDTLTMEIEAAIAGHTGDDPHIVMSGDVLTGLSFSGPYTKEHADALAATSELKTAVPIGNPQPMPAVPPSDRTEAGTPSGATVATSSA